MGAYKKDINYIIQVEDVESMLRMAKSPRDKCLISMLYLTGGREGEIIMVQDKDVWVSTIKDKDYVCIKLPTTKLGRSKGFTIKDRTLEFPMDTIFIEHI